MSLDFYRISRGLDINGNVQILEGSGAPGASGDSSTAPIGTIYINRDTGEMFIKHTSGVGVDNWTHQAPKLDGEPQGFTDRTQVTLSFDDGTRTLTLTGTYNFYSNGSFFTKTNGSFQISDVEGIHWIYYDDTGTLQEDIAFDLDLIVKNCLVASLYWDATNKQAIPNVLAETHGCEMPADTHVYLHQSIGCKYVSGLAISLDSAGDGSLDSHAQFTSSGGVVFDEDITHDILTRANLTDPIRVLYRSGASSLWRMGAASAFPVLTTGTGRAAFNEYTGGAWQLTEVPNGDYVLAHIYAIPGINPTAGNLVAFMGTQSYATLVAAREGAYTEAASTLSGLPIAEFSLVATLIIQTSNTFTNTVKSHFVPTDTGEDYLDWRIATPTANPASSTAVWGNITGTISNQLDLQAELDAKLDLAGGTMTGQLVLDSTGLALSNGSTFTSGTADPLATSLAAPVGSLYVQTDGSTYSTIWQKYDADTNGWVKLCTLASGNDLGDFIVKNGVTDRASSSISFDDGTRTFTIAPTDTWFEIYSFDKRYEYTSAQTVVIPDVEGTHIVYFDNTGTLVSATGQVDDADDARNAYCAAIRWDATNKVSISFADERHGREMDNIVRFYLHETVHTRWGTGFGPINFTVDGSGASDLSAQFGFEDGELWDEDLLFDWTNGSPQTLAPYASVPIYYKVGADASHIWRKTTANTFPVAYGLAGTNTLGNWNELVGANWQISEATDGNFILMHYFATNNSYEPVVAVMGRGDYATLAAATEASDSELADTFSYILYDTPIEEYTPLATFIFETSSTFTNTPKCRAVTSTNGDAYKEWRGTTIATVAGGGSLSAVWGSITGTLSDQSDLQAELDAKLNLAGGTMTGQLVLDSTGLAFDTTATLTSGTINPYDTGLAAPIGSVYVKTAGSDFAETFQKYDTGANDWVKLVSAQNDSGFGDFFIKNGMTARSQSTISFDDGTRTLTITPTGAFFEFYAWGKRYTKTSAQTTTIPDTEGSWYIYFDNTGTLVNANGATDDADEFRNAYVAALYWDATNKVSLSFVDERHGREMDNLTRKYLHETLHTRWGSGFDLINYTIDGDGSLDTHAEFGFTDGVIWDEDLEFEWVDGSPQDIAPYGYLPIYYKTGADASNIWRKTTANIFPVAYGLAGGNTRANFNELVGGNYQISEATSGNYVVMHYFATNNEYEPVIAVMGRQQYSTLANATDAAERELPETLSFIKYDTPVEEYAPLYSIIFQTDDAYTNTPKSRMVTMSNGIPYKDWRGSVVVTVSGSGTLATTWGSITGTLSDQTDLWNQLQSQDELSEMLDVTITGVADGDMLVYDNGTSMWINTPAVEYIQDAIGTAIGAGTQIGVDLTYNDAGNSISVTNRTTTQRVVGKITGQNGTTSIPQDTSTPLVTEGTQIWSQAITPHDTTSRIEIDWSWTATTGANANIVVALFRDTTCIFATSATIANGNDRVQAFKTYDLPTTTSPVTYSVRVGSSTTWYINQPNQNAGWFGNLAYNSAYELLEVIP